MYPDFTQNSSEILEYIQRDELRRQADVHLLMEATELYLAELREEFDRAVATMGRTHQENLVEDIATADTILRYAEKLIILHIEDMKKLRKPIAMLKEAVVGSYNSVTWLQRDVFRPKMETSLLCRLLKRKLIANEDKSILAIISKETEFARKHPDAFLRTVTDGKSVPENNICFEVKYVTDPKIIKKKQKNLKISKTLSQMTDDEPTLKPNKPSIFRRFFSRIARPFTACFRTRMDSYQI